MFWARRIPNYNIANHYVYFNDLTKTNPDAQPSTNIKKELIYESAQTDINKGIEELEFNKKLDIAVDFIQKVAESERQKEMRFANDYIAKHPELKKEGLSAELMQTDPLRFYTELTRYVNENRTSALEYKNALMRLKQNVQLEIEGSGEFAKNSMSEYFKDDVIYRLAGDLEVFVNKLTRRSYAVENDTAFSAKMRNAALRVLKEMNVAHQVENGSEFLAIATAIYSDLSIKVQEEYQKNRTKKEEYLDKMNVKAIADEYIKILKNSQKENLTTVQKALINPASPEFKILIDNGRNSFGLKDLQGEELVKNIKKINKIDEQYKKDTQENKKRNLESQRKKIEQILLQDGQEIFPELRAIKFSIGKKDIAHGNIVEYLTSIITNKLNGAAYNVGRANKAVDILSFSLMGENNEFMQRYGANQLINIINKFYANQSKIDSTPNAHRKVLQKKRTQELEQLAKEIDKSILKLEQMLKSKGINEDLFIFHESLKEYSSIETGKRTSYSGRTLNILSAFDEIYAAMQHSGIDSPTMDKDLITLLSLNLSEQSVGQGKTVAPLTKYLSIFAGLLMFDDVINIAKDIVYGIDKEQQVFSLHVYKLNRIYVPASLILSYISDGVLRAEQEALQGMGATATIHYSEATKIINDWVHTKEEYQEKGALDYYHVSQWREVASKVASSTKVEITFMAAFLRFIEQLLM